MRSIVLDDARKGIWIPSEIYTIPELSFAEKIILSEVVSLHFKGKCYAGNGYFARLLGVGQQQVSDSIRHLVKCEYIRCWYERNEKYEKAKRRVIYPCEEKIFGIKENLYITTDVVKENLYTNDGNVKENLYSTSDVVKENPKDITIYSNTNTGLGLKTIVPNGSINNDYGVPDSLGGISLGDNEKYLDCINYYIDRFLKEMGKKHPRCKSSYWEERVGIIEEECRKKGMFDVSVEQLHMMVDYKFDRMKHINGMQFATFANRETIEGILVNLFFKDNKKLYWDIKKKRKGRNNRSGTGESYEQMEDYEQSPHEYAYSIDEEFPFN